jgi:hypothetical protein
VEPIGALRVPGDGSEREHRPLDVSGARLLEHLAVHDRGRLRVIAVHEVAKDAALAGPVSDHLDTAAAHGTSGVVPKDLAEQRFHASRVGCPDEAGEVAVDREDGDRHAEPLDARDGCGERRDLLPPDHVAREWEQPLPHVALARGRVREDPSAGEVSPAGAPGVAQLELVHRIAAVLPGQVDGLVQSALLERQGGSLREEAFLEHVAHLIAVERGRHSGEPLAEGCALERMETLDLEGVVWGHRHGQPP